MKKTSKITSTARTAAAYITWRRRRQQQQEPWAATLLEFFGLVTTTFNLVAFDTFARTLDHVGPSMTTEYLRRCIVM